MISFLLNLVILICAFQLSATFYAWFNDYRTLRKARALQEFFSDQDGPWNWELTDARYREMFGEDDEEIKKCKLYWVQTRARSLKAVELLLSMNK